LLDEFRSIDQRIDLLEDRLREIYNDPIN